MSSAHRGQMVELQSEADLHQLLVPTPTNDVFPFREPISSTSGASSDAGSFVIPETLSRRNSVYSFSRASFSSQLAGLTSMSLPQAESLAASITALPSARQALKALHSATDQIQLWTRKALKVLDNLDADDDVEWAAAAGRDGLSATEKTIQDFEYLINVYILAIEQLQSRSDIGTLKAEEQHAVLGQMEVTLDGWEQVRADLKKVHLQVEIAMEWEELWAKVLSEVGAELDSLSQLVFEMEERRHTAYQSPPDTSNNQNIDLNELANIVDEPKKKPTSNSRFSLIPTFDSSPLGSPIIENQQDDSNLLALFARMQPLRASLDFLPMRMSLFQSRAEKIFPHACQELEYKKDRLERNWSELSKEAENLRRELSEDRWVIVFRNAGRQAQKMCESVERSVAKVQEAINEGLQRTNPAGLGKRIESYEAKKMHYGPAIQRVLGIIQKGLKDRLTINGEILRLHKDLSTRMRELTDAMEDLDNLLEPVASNQNSKLRESISSIVSADRSFSSTTYAGTPGSSPASSVDFPAQRQDRPVPKLSLSTYDRTRATSVTRPPPISTNNKLATAHGRRPTTPMSSHSSNNLPRRGVSPSPGPPSVYRQGSYIPPTTPLPARPTPTSSVNKPRWSAVVKSDESLTPVARNLQSLNSTRYRTFTPRSISSSTALPLRSPLSRESTASPAPSLTPSVASSVVRRESNQFKSFAERVADPSRSGGLLDPVPYHRGRNATAPVHGTIRSPSSLAAHNKATMSSATAGRSPSANRQPRPNHPPRSSSLQPKQQPRRVASNVGLDKESERRDEAGEESDRVLDVDPSPPSRKTVPRPGSVMAMQKGKRTSMLPVPVGNGRQSALGTRNS